MEPVYSSGWNGRLVHANSVSLSLSLLLPSTVLGAMWYESARLLMPCEVFIWLLRARETESTGTGSRSARNSIHVSRSSLTSVANTMRRRCRRCDAQSRRSLNSTPK
ncbi:hypothetical protein DQ04_14781000 [Trypanosoma grayi]|uniref:hypothetical protein n=1 Tax=Trypanosoma grayi TaxID=71804 RepID=UPI0004F41BB8|nr:hypothetical protein DQ04_14781000 [Trypanosoma grayi]KEG06294.1 hypothetical protein DQ04_14781000 [Trypanosoma grayi]